MFIYLSQATFKSPYCTSQHFITQHTEDSISLSQATSRSPSCTSQHFITRHMEDSKNQPMCLGFRSSGVSKFIDPGAQTTCRDMEHSILKAMANMRKFALKLSIGFTNIYTFIPMINSMTNRLAIQFHEFTFFFK